MYLINIMITCLFVVVVVVVVFCCCVFVCCCCGFCCCCLLDCFFVCFFLLLFCGWGGGGGWSNSLGTKIQKQFIISILISFSKISTVYIISIYETISKIQVKLYLHQFKFYFVICFIFPFWLLAQNGYWYDCDHMTYFCYKLFQKSYLTGRAIY